MARSRTFGLATRMAVAFAALMAAPGAACAPSSFQPPFTYDEAEQIVMAHATCVPVPLRGDTGLEDFSGLNIEGLLSGRQDLRVEDGRCVLAAGSDCQAVRACFGISVNAAGSTCTASTETCTGSSITGCQAAGSTTPAYDWSVDCSRHGEVCYPTAAQGPICAPAPCSRVETRCDGANVVRVCDGRVMVEPCQLGTTCMVVNGLQQCLGASCNTNGCVGDSFEFCASSVYRVNTVLACSAWGQRCDSLATPCVPVSTACDPIFGPPSCDGGTAHYCAPSGEMRTYDCLAHGFGPCELVSSGRRVRCGPTGTRLD